MHKSGLLLACFVASSYGRAVQVTGDKAPNSLQVLAALLQSFELPLSNGRSNQRAHPASKDTALNAPGVGRRTLLGAGVAAAGASLLSSQPAYALFDRELPKGEWANVIFPKGLAPKGRPAYFDGWTPMESEPKLTYKVFAEGTGPKVQKGQNITMYFAGYRMDGGSFMFSYDKVNGRPLTIPAGEGRVVKGIDAALLDMRKGEKRATYIPPELGYGERGLSPMVPPSEPFVFFIELWDLDEKFKGNS